MSRVLLMGAGLAFAGFLTLSPIASVCPCIGCASSEASRNSAAGKIGGTDEPEKSAIKGKSYGAPIEGTPVSVGDVLADPASLNGKNIVVEGTLSQVCQSMGCWFYLQDPATSGDPQPKQIYVDLQGGAVFVVPKNAVGKHGVVAGRVEPNGSDWKIIGKGVVLS